MKNKGPTLVAFLFLLWFPLLSYSLKSESFTPLVLMSETSKLSSAGLSSKVSVTMSGIHSNSTTGTLIYLPNNHTNDKPTSTLHLQMLLDKSSTANTPLTSGCMQEKFQIFKMWTKHKYSGACPQHWEIGRQCDFQNFIQNNTYFKYSRATFLDDTKAIPMGTGNNNWCLWAFFRDT